MIRKREASKTGIFDPVRPLLQHVGFLKRATEEPLNLSSQPKMPRLELIIKPPKTPSPPIITPVVSREFFSLKRLSQSPMYQTTVEPEEEIVTSWPLFLLPKVNEISRSFESSMKENNFYFEDEMTHDSIVKAVSGFQQFAKSSR